MGFTDGEFSTPAGGVSKVNEAKKAIKSKAANPDDEEIVEVKDVAPNAGFAEPPQKEEDQPIVADFYRYGRLETDEEGRSFFADQPRFIDEWNANNSKDQLANIRLKTNKNGKEQDLVPQFSKFFLQRVRESHQERKQVVETFGDFYVFFYGERPPVYNFQGILMNTRNINWLGDFNFYYENYLRGTRAVENQAFIDLTYQGRNIEGFILNSQINQTASTQHGVTLNFQVLVIDRRLVNVSVDFGLLETDGTVEQSPFLQNLLDDQGEGGLSIPNVSKAYNKAQSSLDKEEAAAAPEQPAAADASAISQEYGVDAVSNAAGNLVTA